MTLADFSGQRTFCISLIYDVLQTDLRVYTKVCNSYTPYVFPYTRWCVFLNCEIKQ